MKGDVKRHFSPWTGGGRSLGHPAPVALVGRNPRAPFPLGRCVVAGRPERSRARAAGAAERTLDGEDDRPSIEPEGKGRSPKISKYFAPCAAFMAGRDDVRGDSR